MIIYIIRHFTTNKYTYYSGKVLNPIGESNLVRYFNNKWS